MELRGTTIPEIVAQFIEESEVVSLSVLMMQMQAEGLFAEQPDSPPAMPPDFQPIQVTGKPLSEVIIEERR